MASSVWPLQGCGQRVSFGLMPARDELQPLFLLSDEPIGVSGDDGLKMNQTARVIAEAAPGAATPITIDIFDAREDWTVSHNLPFSRS